jgi:hypothetical protein
MTSYSRDAAVQDGDFRKLFAAFAVGVGELAATMAPGGVPGEAHLAGKRGAATRARELDPVELRLAALEREIERRRRG